MYEGLTVFSHLRALFLTIDGNHHANRYKKNTDKNDKTLFSGSAYFPKTHEYEDYLEPIEVNKEVSTFVPWFWIGLNKYSRNQCATI